MEKLYPGKKQSEDPKLMKLRVEHKFVNCMSIYFDLKTSFNIVLIDAGLKDAFIISLNGSESIDATKKGSLARFINHSWLATCDRSLS